MPARNGSGASGYSAWKPASSAGFREMQGSVALPTPPFAADTSAYNKITNLFTVGPRLGYAFDRWMIYGTGGYASAEHQGAVHFHQHRRAALPGLPRPEPA